MSPARAAARAPEAAQLEVYTAAVPLTALRAVQATGSEQAPTGSRSSSRCGVAAVR
jgi:hypothetical protein